MAQSQPDFIIVGAGHNSLVAGAYLARTGQKVLVLEKNDIAGGGAVSREITLPGFSHDTHAASPVLLQGSPLLTHDELDLTSKYGLELVNPPINEMVIFGDGDTLVWYRDLDQTCNEIAKYSEKDAESYRETVKFVHSVMPVIGMSSARPPLSFGGFVSLLERAPFGNELILAMMRSSYEVIMERFQHPKIQVALLKKSMVSLCGPEERGTGLNILFVLGALHAFPSPAIVGGTQNITRATIRALEAYGGEVRLNQRVKRVINAGGKARSVELADGEILTAKKAVIATIHPHHLGDMVEGLDPGLVRRAKGTAPSQYATLMVHAALNEKIQWAASPIASNCMIINLVDATNVQEFRDKYDDERRGILSKSFATGIVQCSNFDSSRAPAGKFILASYNFVPFNLRDGGSSRWDDIKGEYGERVLAKIGSYTSNMSGSNILAHTVESPLDLVRHSPSFTAGDVMGIGTYIHQAMGLRPTPDLSQYRVPGADGLYLTGPFMHPGGGIGGGGRAVAIRVMEDLKIDSGKLFKI